MVTLSHVMAHNVALKQRGPGDVGLFVGATSGIGLATLNVLIANLNAPRCYIVGRSEAKFASQLARLRQLNPSAIITFIETEIALLRNVDAVCAQLARWESQLDLLYMSPGYLAFGGPHCKWKRCVRHDASSLMLQVSWCHHCACY